METTQSSPDLPRGVRVIEEANGLRVFGFKAYDGTSYRTAELGGNIIYMEPSGTDVSLYKINMAATAPFNPALHHPGGNAPKGAINQTEGTQGPHGDASKSIIHGPEQSVKWDLYFHTDTAGNIVGVEMVCPDLSIEPLDKNHPELGLQFPELNGRPIEVRQFIAFREGGYFQTMIYSHMAAHKTDETRELRTDETKSVFKGPGFHTYYQGNPQRSQIQFGEAGTIIEGATIYPRSNVESVFGLPNDGRIIIRRSTREGTLKTVVQYTGDYYGIGEIRTWTGNPDEYYCIELEPEIPESFNDEDLRFIIDNLTPSELDLLSTRLDLQQAFTPRTFRKLLGFTNDTQLSPEQNRKNHEFAADLRRAIQRILANNTLGTGIWERLSDSPYSGSLRWGIRLSSRPEGCEEYRERLRMQVIKDKNLTEHERSQLLNDINSATIYDPSIELEAEDNIDPDFKRHMLNYYKTHAERHLRLPQDAIPRFRQLYNWQQVKGSFLVHVSVQSQMERRGKIK